LTSCLPKQEERFGSFRQLIRGTGHRYRDTVGAPRRRPPGPAAHARQVQTTAGGSGEITYSRSYTIVPTYECFNKCTYCNFRKDVGADDWMELDHARRTLQDLRRNSDVCEILVLSGEVHPRSKRRAAWVDRIEALCKCVANINRGQLLFTSALVGASRASICLYKFCFLFR
jgi:hypothetical protein